MALAERIRQATGQADKLPALVQGRLERGRNRMRDDAALRDEIMQFWRGNQYVYRTAKGELFSKNTLEDRASRSGKPPHRMRTTRNLILDVVANEVSACTSRIPSYEVAPNKTDAEVVAAAKLAERVAIYGYERWHVRDVMQRMVTFATLCGEAFAWPFFDTTIGPFIRDAEGEAVVGLGDVRYRVLSPNQVYWEPGVRFEESPWHGVEVAMPIEQVLALPNLREDFDPGKLKPDADSDSVTTLGAPSKPSETKLVLVKHYLERPSLARPEGRWLVVANGREICEPVPYPCTDHENRPLDEPVLVKLSYFVDPDNDRDHGLGPHLLDAQRTYNDAHNKALEWKNLAMNPQVFVTPGLLKRQRLTDEPGAVFEVPQPDQNVRWRETPNMPSELFQIAEWARDDIARIAAQNDIPSNVEAGRAIEALIEKDASRRAAFLANVADAYARLARHGLYLVQKHYSEGRLLKFQGRFGPELIAGFRGADLLGQADVRVSPASIEPRSKQAIEQRVMTYAQLGWIPPQAAMAAISGGTAEKLIESYELDVARAHRIIRRIREGADALLAGHEVHQQAMAEYEQTLRALAEQEGQRIAAAEAAGLEPEPMQPPPPPPQPDWMPREFDNIAVHKAVWEDWMKTLDYEEAPAPMKEAADLYYQGLLQIEAKQQAAAMAAQVEQAQQLGMGNAARPTVRQMPDLPAPA